MPVYRKPRSRALKNVLTTIMNLTEDQTRFSVEVVSRGDHKLTDLEIIESIAEWVQAFRKELLTDTEMH